MSKRRVAVVSVELTRYQNCSRAGPGGIVSGWCTDSVTLSASPSQAYQLPERAPASFTITLAPALEVCVHDAPPFSKPALATTLVPRAGAPAGLRCCAMNGNARSSREYTSQSSSVDAVQLEAPPSRPPRKRRLPPDSLKMPEPLLPGSVTPVASPFHCTRMKLPLAVG